MGTLRHSLATGLLVAAAYVPAALGGTAPGAQVAGERADLIVRHARIYTADGTETAQALAVRGDRLLAVGSEQAVLRYRGRNTRVRDLGGRLVIPGLVDAHIHPIDILDRERCDFGNRAMSLAQIEAAVGQCVRRYRPRPGAWLYVQQWNPGEGNQPDPRHLTLRAALDAGAPDNPTELLGSEGHQAAFNSRALAMARNRAGAVVGLSARTLDTDFADLRAYVGVTPSGEPDGRVTDDGRMVIDPLHWNYDDLDYALKVPEKIPARLNSVGITAILDALAAPEGLPVYDALLARQRMTVRANLAVYLDPERYRGADGQVDYDRLIRDASAMRAHFSGQPLVRADFFKVFGDGEVEGNPFAHPPTLGNAALLHPYLQPIFALDAGGHATVRGYVDPDSPACAEVRAQADRYAERAAIETFTTEHGFDPAQCRIWSGKLEHAPEVLSELIRRVHLAGFHVHVHVIGDRTARVIIDDIEAARAADGNAGTHDSLAHLQLVDPEEVRRIGRDGLYVAFTYSWAVALQDYDMTVAPFVQRVIGNDYAQIHAPGSYYEENGYPVRSVALAGGHLVAGSDAPVATRDPQPFVNMAAAVTRRVPGGLPYNPRQAISLREVLDAYTIEGARFLGRDGEIGSLKAGKSADFVVLDRDILALADSGDPDAIAGTQVLETWFRGRRVYRRAAP